MRWPIVIAWLFLYQGLISDEVKKNCQASFLYLQNHLVLLRVHEIFITIIDDNADDDDDDDDR